MGTSGSGTANTANSKSTTQEASTWGHSIRIQGNSSSLRMIPEVSSHDGGENDMDTKDHRNGACHVLVWYSRDDETVVGEVPMKGISTEQLQATLRPPE